MKVGLKTSVVRAAAALTTAALTAFVLTAMAPAAFASVPIAANSSGVASAADAGSRDQVEPQASLPQLEGEVMCPTCGTLLELSHAPAAERERAFIRKLINQGKTEDEIKDALVAEYGSGALAEPDDDGINFWAYVLPLLVFAVALAGVIFAVVTWRRNRDDTSGSPQAGEIELDGADSDRLDRDIARFDL